MLAASSLALAAAGGVAVAGYLAGWAAVRVLAHWKHPAATALVAWARRWEPAARAAAAAGCLLLAVAAMIMTSLSI